MLKNKVYDTIIIGSGPAGLSAAIYAARARLSFIVIEKNSISGGQIINTHEVDNYPGLKGESGFDLGMRIREHAESLGAEFEEDDITEINVGGDELYILKGSNKEYHTKTVIAAMGAGHAKLGVKGEEELNGRGVSYCSTCDGAFFRGKTAAVVGGGNTALEDAIFLARGCEKVYLIHRRNEFRGDKTLQDAVFAADNIEVLWNSVVEEIKGEEKVTSVSVRNLDKKDGVYDLPLSAVFAAVGIVPNTDILKSVLKLSDKGYVIAGEDGKTEVAGIFAAGDLREKPLRQVVTAVADGANAVASVLEFLR